MLKTYLSIAAAAVMTLSITTGCSTNDYVEPQVQLETYTGIFVDAATAGLTFTCDAHSGTTDINGTFSGCFTKDPVSFHLGNLKLGTMTYPKGGVFSPKGLAEAKYPDDATKQTEMKNNIAATVLSMDVDGDPTNGISITPTNIEIFNKTVLEDSVITEPAVITLTKQAVTAVVQAPANTGTMKTVTPEDAAEHLAVVEKEIEEGEYNQPEPVVFEPIPTGTGSY